MIDILKGEFEMVEVRNCWVYFARTDKAWMNCVEGNIYTFVDDFDDDEIVQVVTWTGSLGNESFRTFYGIEEWELNTPRTNNADDTMMLIAFERNDQKAKELFIGQIEKKRSYAEQLIRNAEDTANLLKDQIEKMRNLWIEESD